MKLFTKAEIGEIPVKIQHSDRILTLGSCFAEHIGDKLLTNKFHITCNPFGIIYNPVSLSKSIKRMITSSLIIQEELQLCQNTHCHMDFHSQYNLLDKQATVNGINEAISSVHAFANEGIDWLIISLGTAFVYRYNETNEVVANCHKIPAMQFKRSLLEPNEILVALKECVESIKSINPKSRTIFTVSPIRHTRDGLQQNSRSKARLIDAANEMAELYDECYYYPAFEILIDELRDYRWFEADLIHPNQQAVNHIWNQFKTFALSEESITMIDRIEAIHRNLQHKPFIVESEEYQKFLTSTTSQINKLKQEMPWMDFTSEEAKIIALKQS